MIQWCFVQSFPSRKTGWGTYESKLCKQERFKYLTKPSPPPNIALIRCKEALTPENSESSDLPNNSPPGSSSSREWSEEKLVSLMSEVGSGEYFKKIEQAQKEREVKEYKVSAFVEMSNSLAKPFESIAPLISSGPFLAVSLILVFGFLLKVLVDNQVLKF